MEATTQEETTQNVNDAMELGREVDAARWQQLDVIEKIKAATAQRDAILPAFRAAMPRAIELNQSLEAELARLTQEKTALEELELSKMQEAGKIMGRASRVDAIQREFPGLLPGLAAQVQGATLAEMRVNAQKLLSAVVMPRAATKVDTHRFTGPDDVPFPA